MPLAGVGENVSRAMGFIPLLIVVPAILTDLVLFLGRRWSSAWVAAAIVFGAVVAVEGIFAPTFFDLPPLAPAALTVAAPFLAGLSVLAAFISRQLGGATPPFQRRERGED
jgi:hypothetical protein